MSQDQVLCDFTNDTTMWLPCHRNEIPSVLTAHLVFFISQSKKKFERECREAEKSQMMYDRLDNDINATKSEVEKVVHVFLGLFCTVTVLSVTD